MSALVPIATVLGTVASIGLQAAQGYAAQRQANARSQAQAVQYQVRQQDVADDDKALETQAERLDEVARERIAEARRNQAQSDRLRRDALRRSIARRRAALGARGIDAGGGSAEAILLGLVDESALAGAQEHRRTGDRVGEIRRDLDYRQRQNLLERSRLQGQYRLNQASYAADAWANRTRRFGHAHSSLEGISQSLSEL
jgi:hypothetical protein